MIRERSLDFAAACIRLSFMLNRTQPGRYIGGQLLRASSSCGANYAEACGAESRADFAHKMQVVLKELRESEYWLHLADRSRLAPTEDLSPLLTEVDGLIRMTAKSVLTAKTGLQPKT
jgi:four helix bundle protein